MAKVTHIGGPAFRGKLFTLKAGQSSEKMPTERAMLFYGLPTLKIEFDADDNFDNLSAGQLRVLTKMHGENWQDAFYIPKKEKPSVAARAKKKVVEAILPEKEEVVEEPELAE